jgi:hypothetical protein
MNKEGEVTTIVLINVLAIQIELFLEEKKKKSVMGTNGTNILCILNLKVIYLPNLSLKNK